MKSICIVTSTRTDYGILKPLILGFMGDAEFEMRLAVTGSHLSRKYGMTVNEIEKDQIPIDCRIPILSDGDTPEAASTAMAKALLGFSEYFHARRPDMLIVLGGRYEIAAICCAAVNARISIAHIHGGETTEGAIDECYRHSITKMSYLHFAACEVCRRRIIQLGEAPERVFNVGALGVENVLKNPKLTQDELSALIGFDFHKPYAVMTFHPATRENGTEREQCEALFSALDEYPQVGLLITKSNADPEGQRGNEAIDAFASRRDNCKAVSSLGVLRYLSALQHAEFVIGNSSGGIVEAPSFGIPTINIGDRQKGRLRADSIIDCNAEKDAIARAIEKALSAAFRSKARHTTNPYGAGNTAAQIKNTIKECLLNDRIHLKKSFYDIPFEVTQ
ncbi:MAG: UDP-N-acetylglucosamine 2-epimerase [Candidatus Pelethousia sp.]|nr:UDP-N-acetylglucosamine 2-epimerase [Candidatus Pelethousia sp.]